jgi:hypothetical protein
MSHRPWVYGGALLTHHSHQNCPQCVQPGPGYFNRAERCTQACCQAGAAGQQMQLVDHKQQPNGARITQPASLRITGLLVTTTG